MAKDLLARLLVFIDNLERESEVRGNSNSMSTLTHEQRRDSYCEFLGARRVLTKMKRMVQQEQRREGGPK